MAGEGIARRGDYLDTLQAMAEAEVSTYYQTELTEADIEEILGKKVGFFTIGTESMSPFNQRQPSEVARTLGGIRFPLREHPLRAYDGTTAVGIYGLDFFNGLVAANAPESAQRFWDERLPRAVDTVLYFGLSTGDLRYLDSDDRSASLEPTAIAG